MDGPAVSDPVTTVDSSDEPVPQPVAERPSVAESGRSSETSSGRLRRFGPPANLSPVPRRLAKQRSATRHVPDIALDWLDTQVGRVRALSARGHMHRYLAEVRQDSFGIGAPDGYLTLAVADGVGSSSASHIGSAYAARASVGHDGLVASLADPSVDTVSLDFLSSAMQTMAAENNLQPRQLSSTLMLAAVADQRPSTDGFEVTLAQVGDSSAWRLRDGRWIELGAGPEDTESPIVTAVESLPLCPIARVWREIFRPGETLALVSDGIGNILPANQDFADALAELWRTDAPVPADLLSVLDATIKSYDDDRTFVGLHFAELPT
ncbi:protein phosphatase 2C domain-containing protein [Kribbella sp. NBC_00482]|uniref:protein phosphatase 2C domain-containing protein n=1 Tax=Kribbella sp. NBC_00482 TaxID=2975968 RepID=UPI002E1899FD